MEVIRLLVIEWVGGRDCVDSFAGGFNCMGACFATMFVVFEPLVFPGVFAASESGLLPVNTFFGGGCSDWWLVCVFEWPAAGSKIQLVAVLLGASGPHHA
jgi:hypothetical protein